MLNVTLIKNTNTNLKRAKHTSIHLLSYKKTLESTVTVTCSILIGVLCIFNSITQFSFAKSINYKYCLWCIITWLLQL